MTALILLAQGCEELEAITCIDLLRRGNIKVTVAGLSNQTIIASRGVKIEPDITIGEIKNKIYDMVILPGGLPGADNLNASNEVHELLNNHHKNNKWLAAICAAPKVFAKAGFLNNRNYTCYPDSVNEIDLVSSRYLVDAVVVDDNIVTSRGPGTAIDFALKLIELLSSEEVKDVVEQQLLRS